MFKLIFPLTSLFVCSVGYSQISGTVKDQTGAPIENALVCHSKNPSVWTKTDDDGKFSLPSGNSNTALRIGALRYETIKSQTIGSGTITMATDALIEKEGDVLHVGFDNLRPGNTYTKNELKDDFRIAYSKGFYEKNDESTDRASADYNESIDPGGVSLKVRFPKGQFVTDNSGIDTRIPLSGTFNTNYYQSTDLYLSYWVKFSENFDFDKCGGKLPSLGGTSINSPSRPDDKNKNAWKGRIMWRNGGSIQFYMEVPGKDNWSPSNEERFWGSRMDNENTADICLMEYQNYLNKPGWHNIELHYRFETPGKDDGIFEGWVDGKNHDIMKASVFNNYRLQGSRREDITINRLLISAFLGGSSKPEKYVPNEDTYAWFDEFRVSETRINEYDKYTVTLSNPNFESTNNTNTIYPIPSRDGVFYLKKESSWEVYDLMGKKLISGTGKTIQLEGYSQGMYFVRLDQKEAQRVILE